MNVTVLGAGAWGTALAISAARRGVNVVLWARDEAQALQMQSSRCNARYLPDVPLPEGLQITSDWSAAMAHAMPATDKGLVIIGTPMAALADMLSRVPESAPVFWLCKGFEKTSGRLGHEIALTVRPQGRSGVLSGPSFAIEVARGQPTALVAASSDEALNELAVEAFHSDSLRVYTSPDPVGVEVGGAVKNVLAIATGIADGLQLGLNARAALITRGLAEMTRLGVALGARLDTFMGLSGLGDLVLTATGDLSRNRSVGLQLAQGKDLPTILQELGHVSEGVYSAATVLARAQGLGVVMPITQAVVEVLEGRLSARSAVQALMMREARAES
ncbi:MAG TPA: NAD(P)H-dependent glycerol-3-phosphate dehydrogenase [Aquabacterium sp.]|uniref:NAD(P)H-dependent glycerol-3-phosphate dehydrogenase n=1 Tax=Aquabacterium sp. TaxID=1872578 RepID=UPI002E331962|nr:NAD(P)H-dependent glycerol-3-phosphate dehydrogenase [Aquabacterium sp.]HEX5373125.1 NAD(P)H-dependent glycerol-3-phosphate dehydrogenase [Aquabacterium sp.]